MLVCLNMKYGISLKNLKYFFLFLSIIIFLSSPVEFLNKTATKIPKLVAPVPTGVANSPKQLGERCHQQTLLNSNFLFCFYFFSQDFSVSLYSIHHSFTRTESYFLNSNRVNTQKYYEKCGISPGITGLEMQALRHSDISPALGYQFLNSLRYS